MANSHYPTSPLPKILLILWPRRFLDPNLGNSPLDLFSTDQRECQKYIDNILYMVILTSQADKDVRMIHINLFFMSRYSSLWVTMTFFPLRYVSFCIILYTEYPSWTIVMFLHVSLCFHISMSTFYVFKELDSPFSFSWTSKAYSIFFPINFPKYNTVNIPPPYYLPSGVPCR